MSVVENPNLKLFEIQLYSVINFHFCCWQYNPIVKLISVPFGLPNILSNQTNTVNMLRHFNIDNNIYEIWPLVQTYMEGFFLFGEQLHDTRKRSEIYKILQRNYLSLSRIWREIVTRQLGNVFSNSTLIIFPFACPNQNHVLSSHYYYLPFVI